MPWRRGRTNEWLIYRATYITGSKTATTLLLLLLLLFPYFFIVLFVSIDRPVLPFIETVYQSRYNQLVHPLIRLAYRFQWRESQGFTFIFWRSRLHTRSCCQHERAPLLLLVENTVFLSFRFISLSRHSTLLDSDRHWTSLSNPFLSLKSLCCKIQLRFSNISRKVSYATEDITLVYRSEIWVETSGRCNGWLNLRSTSSFDQYSLSPSRIWRNTQSKRQGPAG